MSKFIGLALALTSNIFIGVSFIITKKALLNSEGHGSSESHAYLKNKMWWLGTGTMILGELANFASYSLAPAFLVTPMGALSVIIGAVLSHFFLGERLGVNGKIGGLLSLIGSTLIVLHALEEEELKDVDQILEKARNVGFILYALCAIATTIFLIKVISPKYGKKHVIVYVSICSLMGSLSVMACKGLGIAISLTFGGNNMFNRFSTYFLASCSAACIGIQINYFNKALDIFSTTIVTPIYYVFFTTATIIASVCLYGINFASSADSGSSAIKFASAFCGFVTIFLGVYLLSQDKAGGGDFRGSFASGLIEDKGAKADAPETLTGRDRRVSSIQRSEEIDGYAKVDQDMESLYSGSKV